MDERFEKQLRFLVEIDKMKTVLRQTVLVDKSRQENDAEHSWHFAVMAMILYEYADASRVDLSRVLKMALVHDLIEIYAGDTAAFDEAGLADKTEREEKAADKLFGLLPPDQGEEIRSLWAEFDAMETPDAQYANAIDRLQPFINDYMAEGLAWPPDRVTSEKLYQRLAVVRKSAPELWEFVEHVVEDSIKKGYII